MSRVSAVRAAARMAAPDLSCVLADFPTSMVDILQYSPFFPPALCKYVAIRMREEVPPSLLVTGVGYRTLNVQYCHANAANTHKIRHRNDT